MYITKNIKIIDLGLFLKKENAIIFSDFHIGYDESLNKGGILIPRFQFKDIMDRLKKIIKKINGRQIPKTNKTIQRNSSFF